MKSFDSRSLALVMAVTGALLTVHGIVFAVPTSDGCCNWCQGQNFFIQSPGLFCRSYNPSTCWPCTDGRCQNFVGPPLPTCQQSNTLTTTLQSFNAGCCNPSCDLNLNSWSQASDPSTGCTANATTTVPQYICVNQ